MKQILSLALVISVIGCTTISNEKDQQPAPQKNEATSYTLNYMVDKWSESFVQKIDSSYQATLVFYLADSSLACHVKFSNKEFE